MLRLMRPHELLRWLWARRRGAAPTALAAPPDPALARRLRQALADTLPGSRSLALGVVPAPDGRLAVAEPWANGLGIVAAVEPGTYEVTVTIVRLVHDEGAVVDERIAHAFARLPGRDVAAIEPLLAAGRPQALGVDGGTASFGTPGIVARLAAERTGGDAEDLDDLVIAALQRTYADTRSWCRIEAADGAALVAFSSGFGDGGYPIHRLLDGEGRAVGLALDFLIDPTE